MSRHRNFQFLMQTVEKKKTIQRQRGQLFCFVTLVLGRCEQMSTQPRQRMNDRLKLNYMNKYFFFLALSTGVRVRCWGGGRNGSKRVASPKKSNIPSQGGRQLTRTGKLEHTVQLAGSSICWRVFSCNLVGLSVFWATQFSVSFRCLPWFLLLLGSSAGLSLLQAAELECLSTGNTAYVLLWKEWSSGSCQFWGLPETIVLFIS